MDHISSRLYEDEKDLRILIDLITKLRPPEHLYDYPVKVDIEENLALAATRLNTRLWFDGDQPIGWAYVDEWNNLLWEFDKRYTALLGLQIIRWGEVCVRRIHSHGEWRTLGASCREDDAERIAVLKQFGFRQTEGATIRLVRDLSTPIPEPKLPQGFVLRPIAGVEEAEAVAAMHRAAFRTDYMTTENRLTIMKTSEYDPSLDLIARAPDGTIAANCICSVNEVSKIGNTDPIATHPDYQRMGLARALLLTGLGLLKERGMSFAQLGTSGENIAMQKTAESMGFIMKYKTLWFSKEVS
jgi:GNAT superfamily N-acetyltransferase